VSELLNDEVANGFILRPAPLLFVNFSPAVTNKGVFQYLGPQHAADQVNADGFKIGCATTCHDFRSFTARMSYLEGITEGEAKTKAPS
jgi:hypothetical protein